MVEITAVFSLEILCPFYNVEMIAAILMSAAFFTSFLHCRDDCSKLLSQFVAKKGRPAGSKFCSQSNFDRIFIFLFCLVNHSPSKSQMGKNLKKWKITKIYNSRYLCYVGSDADKNAYHIVKCHSASGLFSYTTQFEQCLQR